MPKKFYVGIWLAVLAGLLTVATSLTTSSKLVFFNKHNTVILRGEIEEALASNFIKDMLENKASVINVYIASPGGSIIEGARMIEAIQAVQAQKRVVNCIVDTAASMAFIISQTCTNRYVLSGAVMMQHEASYAVRGQAPNARSMVNFLERMVEILDQMQAKRIGITYEQFKLRIRSDWWLFGQDAVDYRAADEVKQATCTSDLSQGLYTEEVETFLAKAVVTWSKCPLISFPVDIKVKGENLTREQQLKVIEFARAKVNYKAALMSGRPTPTGGSAFNHK